MNRKEKDIIKAYLKAVKHASQLESRIRIMLIGDSASGERVYSCVLHTYTCSIGSTSVTIQVISLTAGFSSLHFGPKLDLQNIRSIME